MTQRPYWKWLVCGWLLLATMILYMDRLVLTQQDEDVRRAVGIYQTEDDKFRWGLLDSAFSVAFACGALLAGWLADRWRVWLLYPLVVVLWSAVGVITGVVEGYWALFVCRFFLGFFEAGHWPCALKTTQRILEPSQRTLGNGILQSGAAIGSVLTPALLLFLAYNVSTSWRVPFVVVGAMGILWAAGWFLLIPRGELLAAPPEAQKADTGTLADVLRDRRFWVVVAVVVCINSTWHFFRVWMPTILKEVYGFDKFEVQGFSIIYYLAADLGSLATGFFSVWLVWGGMSVHGSRLAVFGLCSVLAMLSLVAVVAPGNPVFLVVLPVIAFASLGLFPPYYSFSQELTVRNQGKVTGALGFICWMVMAGLRAVEGLVADMVNAQGGSLASQYFFGLLLAGIMPLVGLFILIRYWPRAAPKEAAAAVAE